jgi:hypothetical protein
MYVDAVYRFTITWMFFFLYITIESVFKSHKTTISPKRKETNDFLSIRSHYCCALMAFLLHYITLRCYSATIKCEFLSEIRKLNERFGLCIGKTMYDTRNVYSIQCFQEFDSRAHLFTSWMKIFSRNWGKLSILYFLCISGDLHEF